MTTTSALTNYGENNLVDHMFSTAAFTKPVNVYIKLHTGDPGEDATLNAAGETSRLVTAWAAASGLAIATNAQIQWGSVSTAETVSHWSAWDASTAGNPLFYGDFSTATAVDPGDTFTIASGDIDLDFLSTMLTTYAANAMLDHITGRAAWTMPSGVFIKMHLGAPGVDATANPAAETTRAGDVAFDASVAGATENTGIILWSSVSNTETVSHWSAHDAVTAGNPLCVGTMDAAKSLVAGQNAEFAAGALDLSLT